MPAQHTVFCKAAAAVKRLTRKQIGDPFEQKIVDAIVAQQACLEAINNRLHRLEDLDHGFDPHRPLGGSSGE